MPRDDLQVLFDTAEVKDPIFSSYQEDNLADYERKIRAHRHGEPLPAVAETIPAPPKPVDAVSPIPVSPAEEIRGKTIDEKIAETEQLMRQLGRSARGRIPANEERVTLPDDNPFESRELLSRMRVQDAISLPAPAAVEPPDEEMFPDIIIEPIPERLPEITPVLAKEPLPVETAPEPVIEREALQIETTPEPVMAQEPLPVDAAPEPVMAEEPLQIEPAPVTVAEPVAHELPSIPDDGILFLDEPEPELPAEICIRRTQDEVAADAAAIIIEEFPVPPVATAPETVPAPVAEQHEEPAVQEDEWQPWEEPAAAPEAAITAEEIIPDVEPPAPLAEQLLTTEPVIKEKPAPVPVDLPEPTAVLSSETYEIMEEDLAEIEIESIPEVGILPSDIVAVEPAVTTPLPEELFVSVEGTTVTEEPAALPEPVLASACAPELEPEPEPDLELETGLEPGPRPEPKPATMQPAELLQNLHRLFYRASNLDRLHECATYFDPFAYPAPGSDLAERSLLEEVIAAELSRAGFKRFALFTYDCAMKCYSPAYGTLDRLNLADTVIAPRDPLHRAIMENPEGIILTAAAIEAELHLRKKFAPDGLADPYYLVSFRNVTVPVRRPFGEVGGGLPSLLPHCIALLRLDRDAPVMSLVSLFTLLQRRLALPFHLYDRLRLREWRSLQFGQFHLACDHIDHLLVRFAEIGGGRGALITFTIRKETHGAYVVRYVAARLRRRLPAGSIVLQVFRDRLLVLTAAAGAPEIFGLQDELNRFPGLRCHLLPFTAEDAPNRRDDILRRLL